MTDRTATTPAPQTIAAENARELKGTITDRLRHLVIVTKTLSTIVSQMDHLAGVGELADELETDLEEISEQVTALYQSMLPASARRVAASEKGSAC